MAADRGESLGEPSSLSEATAGADEAWREEASRMEALSELFAWTLMLDCRVRTLNLILGLWVYSRNLMPSSTFLTLAVSSSPKWLSSTAARCHCSEAHRRSSAELALAATTPASDGGSGSSSVLAPAAKSTAEPKMSLSSSPRAAATKLSMHRIWLGLATPSSRAVLFIPDENAVKLPFGPKIPMLTGQ